MYHRARCHNILNINLFEVQGVDNNTVFNIIHHARGLSHFGQSFNFFLDVGTVIIGGKPAGNRVDIQINGFMIQIMQIKDGTITGTRLRQNLAPIDFGKISEVVRIKKVIMPLAQPT